MIASNHTIQGSADIQIDTDSDEYWIEVDQCGLDADELELAEFLARHRAQTRRGWRRRQKIDRPPQVMAVRPEHHWKPRSRT